MKKRCFISINLPENVIEEIVKIQKQLEKENLFAGKFTEPENLHLTLKFLGEVDEEKIEEIKRILSKIKFNSFETEIGELGVFSEEFIKIIWIKLNREEILELQKEIDNSLKDLFEEEKRFMSHLTIARVKKVKDRKILTMFLNKIKIKNTKFNVDKFYLMESKLSKNGPVYTIIEGYDLN